MGRIEVEVQFEHVDARVSEKSQLAAFGVGCDDGPNVRFTHVPFVSDAWDLKIRGFRRNVRVKT